MYDLYHRQEIIAGAFLNACSATTRRLPNMVGSRRRAVYTHILSGLIWSEPGRTNGLCWKIARTPSGISYAGSRNHDVDVPDCSPAWGRAGVRLSAPPQ
jgi:uncharacterized circularly permuted ATP-grasp superfamily protein